MKEGTAEEERHMMTAGEERAEARARVMMAANRLQQPSIFDQKLNNGERSTSVRGEERLLSTEGERLMMKAAGEERLKMSERQPLESVSLVMRAGERPNKTGERFSREERSAGEILSTGERHLKEGRLVGREGEADSDRGSSVDTTDDSGHHHCEAFVMMMMVMAILLMYCLAGSEVAVTRDLASTQLLATNLHV